MTVRTFNLVAPLAPENHQAATAMRIADTAGLVAQDRSGAVSLLTGCSGRQGDVDSANKRSTPATQTTPGIRISKTETRTTTTRAVSYACVPSADQNLGQQYTGGHADFSFEELVQAYLDCRRNKRNKMSALAFELNLEANLCQLDEYLRNGSYCPGRSICFVITRPKPREVWAAEFRDRIVHHLLYNKISPRFYAGFIAESCACIPGRGTLYGARRLEAKIRSITQNWSKPAHYLKLDLANFFVSIDKNILRGLIAKRVTEPWWMNLADIILFHDPRQDYELRGAPDKLNLVLPHKRLGNHPAHLGLPIGNLSSQFFANIYLDTLDQFCKHQLQAKHYIRYVDDFVLLNESPQWLNAAKWEIEEFLRDKLHARINPTKTILQPVERGVDFVGQVIRPWHRVTRKRTVMVAMNRVRNIAVGDLFETANSYYGLLGQATHSHHQRAELSNILRYRGHCVSRNLTKTYRKSA